MELAARIYDCFRVTDRGALLMFEFSSDAAKLRVGDKIQLRTPAGGVKDTVIKGIEHVKPLKRDRPYNVALALEPPYHDQLFAKNTGIWIPGLGESDSSKTD